MDDMMMPEGMPMDPMMGGGAPPPGGMPMDPMMGGGMPPMDMMPPPEGEAPMEPMGEELAEEGRNGDQIVGHLTPGEIVIPVDIQDEELMSLLDEFFAENGLSMGQYTVGNEENSVNPETGMPEFFLGGLLGLGGGGGGDPRRTYARKGSYYGYSGAEKPMAGMARGGAFKATQEDYDAFDVYMTNYKQNRSIEDRKIKELTSGFGTMTNVMKMALNNSGYEHYSFNNDPDFQAYKEDFKKYGYLMRNNKYSSGYDSLTPYQRQGAYKHGEKYQESWDSMDKNQKREIFEDYMNTLKKDRDAPYTGSYAGAGGAYGSRKGTAYVSLRDEQREADFASFEAAQQAEQDQYLEQLQMQLEAERERAAAARKEALSREARVARLQSNSKGSTPTTAASEGAAGSVADPRSMISRSYSRRASYGGGGTVSGFRASGSSDRPL